MTQELSVSLPESTLYVSGTVNEVEYTWTLSGANTWSATVARAEDGTYEVSLTIISYSGQSTTAQFTLYYGLLNLITDRTQADVDYALQLDAAGWTGMTADQKSEWLAGLKGAYNATDLNRVGSAMNYVAGRLLGYGYQVNVSPKIDWTDSDIPTQPEMEDYLGYVRAIRGAITVPADAPEVPDDMIGLTYIEANNIEEILLIVDALITNMANAWYYSGEIQGGEV